MAINKLYNLNGGVFNDGLTVLKQTVDCTGGIVVGDYETLIEVPEGYVIFSSYISNLNDDLVCVDGAKATGTVTFTGEAGATIASGTIVETSDGIQFKTTEAGTIEAEATTVDVAVEAILAGTTGNVAIDGIDVIPKKIEDVTSVTNAAATTGGTDSTVNLKYGSTALWSAAKSCPQDIKGKGYMENESVPIYITTDSKIKLTVGVTNIISGQLAVGVCIGKI